MIWTLNEVSGNKFIIGGRDKRIFILDLNANMDFELYKDKDFTLFYKFLILELILNLNVY